MFGGLVWVFLEPKNNLATHVKNVVHFPLHMQPTVSPFYNIFNEAIYTTRLADHNGKELAFEVEIE